MSPSALSRCIKRLEDEVGHPLFVRDKRSVSLTPAGKVFQEYAQDSLARWELLEHKLNSEATELQGEIRLYCSVTASYSFLSRILAAFRLKHPGIEIKLHTGDQAYSIDRVQAGEDDIVVAAHPGSLPSRLSFQPMARSALRLIAPSTPCYIKELVSESPLPWDRLPVILPETGVTRKLADQWFRRSGIKPYKYAQVSGHEAIVGMVGLGFGVAMVPEVVIAGSPLRESIQLLSVSPELEPFDIGLCVMTKRLDDSLVKAFWDIAAETVASG